MSAAHPSYVTVTSGIRGFFAMLLTWTDSEHGWGYYEPYSTGIGSYRTAAEAEPEARSWAEAEGLEYRAP